MSVAMMAVWPIFESQLSALERKTRSLSIALAIVCLVCVALASAIAMGRLSIAAERVETQSVIHQLEADLDRYVAELEEIREAKGITRGGGRTTEASWIVASQR